MAWSCPICGGEKFEYNQVVCDSCHELQAGIGDNDGDDEPVCDDPNQCPSCGDNLADGEMCVHCDY